MKYFSTRNQSIAYSFSDAIKLGLAPDGGLFMPETIPACATPISELLSMPREERITSMLFPFVEDELSRNELLKLVGDIFTFPIITRQLDDDYSILELFHGPTLAFKDFGARFLARMLGHFFGKSEKHCVVLVATSGDTGSAVANAFHNVAGIEVVILYPSKKVSDIQEKQLTTFGGNIQAIEIAGTFDDCQKLVKQAFLDPELSSKLMLTSANSINIARLLPQAVYYMECWLELQQKNSDINFVVPSGNLGNLTAGIIGKHICGADFKFTSALNMNDVFEDFLNTGTYSPRDSVPTLSNAMDVGAPSNLERVRFLLHDSDKLKELINAYHFSDLETLGSMRQVYDVYGEIIDPHTAVGFTAARKNKDHNRGRHQVILATAHPAKFGETVKNAIGTEPEIPERLKEVLSKQKESILCGSGFPEFSKTLSTAIDNRK